MNVIIWNPTSPNLTFMWSGVERIVSDGKRLCFLDGQGAVVEAGIPMGLHPIEFTLDDDGAVT